MKKGICVLLVFLLVVALPGQCFASNSSVLINGTQVNDFFVKNGTTYVALREIASLLGLDLKWDSTNKVAILTGKNVETSQTALPSITVREKENAFLKVIDQKKAEIIDISKKIWTWAETGSKEFKSAALLEDALEKEGFKVTRGVKGIDPFDNSPIDLPTAFIATFEKTKGGPTIGIMLEYDALPMGHACGHNLIAASGYAAALAVKAALENSNIPGKLVVLGTPAEETGVGKVPMLHGGLFKGIDAVLITHPSDRWDTSSEVLAIAWPRGEVITFKGVASHASSDPEKGKSALDAAMLFGINLEFIREHMIDGSRIHYCILEGGSVPNVVPDTAKVDVYVRAKDTSYLYELMRRVDNAAKAAALATDTTVEYEWDYPWLAPVPVPSLYGLVRQAAVGLGVPESAFKKPTALGSSDFGCVGYEIPTVNLDFAIAPEGTPGHSQAFMEAAKSDSAHEAALKAAKVIALSAYKLYTDPALLANIKAEFAANKK